MDTDLETRVSNLEEAIAQVSAVNQQQATEISNLREAKQVAESHASKSDRMARLIMWSFAFGLLVFNPKVGMEPKGMNFDFQIKEVPQWLALVYLGGVLVIILDKSQIDSGIQVVNAWRGKPNN